MSGIQDITFFVNSTAPALLADYTYDRTVTTLGTNVTTPFLFIQEALDAAISYQEQYLNASLNVTIYLGSGDHFLFHCDGSEDYSGVSATLVAYCTEFGNSLQQRYSLFDNYTVTIKPLYCSLRNLLLMQNSTDFNYTCLATDTLKPVIYVNHANTYFNISGAFTVENVKFSGLNAMAVPTDSSYDLTRYPAVFCKVTTEPNGYEAIFKLVKYDNTNSNSFDYTCSDKWYTAP